MYGNYKVSFPRIDKEKYRIIFFFVKKEKVLKKKNGLDNNKLKISLIYAQLFYFACLLLSRLGRPHTSNLCQMDWTLMRIESYERKKFNEK